MGPYLPALLSFLTYSLSFALSLLVFFYEKNKISSLLFYQTKLHKLSFFLTDGALKCQFALAFILLYTQLHMSKSDLSFFDKRCEYVPHLGCFCNLKIDIKLVMLFSFIFLFLCSACM